MQEPETPPPSPVKRDKREKSRGSGGSGSSGCDCEARESYRTWRNLYPALLSVFGAGIIAIAVHSCSVAREAGNLEGNIGYISEQQKEHGRAIKELRTIDSNLRSSVQGDQSQVLIQLGRLEEKINGMSSRLGQVEEVLIQSGDARRRRYGTGN